MVTVFNHFSFTYLLYGEESYMTVGRVTKRPYESLYGWVVFREILL